MSPGLWIEVRSLEHRNEVLISELVRRTISGNVMLVDLAALNVHLPRIPLAPKRRNGIDSPVDKYAELGVLVPLGHLVLTERFIVRPEWPVMANPLNVLKDRFPLPIVLTVAGLPLPVKNGRVGPSCGCILRQARCSHSYVNDSSKIQAETHSIATPSMNLWRITAYTVSIGRGYRARKPASPTHLH